MPVYSNVNGVWKDVQSAHATINGVTKSVDNRYVNVNGVWRAVDSTSNPITWTSQVAGTTFQDLGTGKFKVFGTGTRRFGVKGMTLGIFTPVWSNVYEFNFTVSNIRGDQVLSLGIGVYNMISNKLYPINSDGTFTITHAPGSLINGDTNQMYVDISTSMRSASSSTTYSLQLNWATVNGKKFVF